MEREDYFVVDIETCPADLDGCQKLDEEERKKLINPIDSRIIAIGLRHNGKNLIFAEGSEKRMLEQFWDEWMAIKQENPYSKIVGFNIKDFDLPFLISKSLVNNIVISPFLIKDVIDLREKINAYRYGKSRGTLKEYANLIGEKTMGLAGGDIIRLCANKEHETIVKYLNNDLEITDALYRRVRDTKIIHIDRW